MKRICLFTIFSVILSVMATSTRGAVSVLGDVSVNGYGALIVGDTNGGSQVQVTGGSILSAGNPLFPGWDGRIHTGESISAGLCGITVTGTGSVLTCFGLAVGASGSFNHLEVTDGASFYSLHPDWGIVTGNGMWGFGQQIGVSSNNSVLVSGPGTLLSAENATTGVSLDGTGDRLTLQDGARINGSLAMSGTNQLVEMRGIGTIWDLGANHYGFDITATTSFLVVRDGAQMIGLDGWVGGVGGGFSITGAGSSVILTGTLQLFASNRVTIGTASLLKAADLLLSGIFTNAGSIEADRIKIEVNSQPLWFGAGTIKCGAMVAKHSDIIDCGC
jgi:hypothetical protein